MWQKPLMSKFPRSRKQVLRVRIEQHHTAFWRHLHEDSLRNKLTWLWQLAYTNQVQYLARWIIRDEIQTKKWSQLSKEAHLHWVEDLKTLQSRNKSSMLSSRTMFLNSVTWARHALTLVTVQIAPTVTVNKVEVPSSSTCKQWRKRKKTSKRQNKKSRK